MNLTLLSITSKSKKGTSHNYTASNPVLVLIATNRKPMERKARKLSTTKKVKILM